MTEIMWLWGALLLSIVLIIGFMFAWMDQKIRAEFWESMYKDKAGL